MGERSPDAHGRIDERGSVGEASASCAPGAGEGITSGAVGWVTVTLQPGRYELTLSLPKGERPRRVWIGKRNFLVASTRHVTVPTDGSPLVVQVKVPPTPLGARALGVQVLALRFVPR